EAVSYQPSAFSQLVIFCRQLMADSFSHRHRPPLMRSARRGDVLSVAGDDADALVETSDDVGRRADFEEGELVLAAGGKDAVARRLHRGRIGIETQRLVAEGEAKIARAHLGEAEAGDGEDLLALRDALGALDLDAEQQFARRVERP